MMDINNIPDHPVVRNMMETGTPDGELATEHICPKCGEYCDFFYMDMDKEIVGCENCIAMYDAEEYYLEHEENDDREE